MPMETTGKSSILIHIVGGVAGIWSGTLIMLGLWEIIWLSTPQSSYTDCSGTPCSIAEFFTPIATAAIGGTLGAVIAYSVLQRLSHRPIRMRSLLISGVIGLILWPVIGLLWLLIVFFIAPPVRSVGGSIIISALILTLLGTAIGALSGLINNKVASSRSGPSTQN